MEDLGAGLPLAMMDGPITAMEMPEAVDIPAEPEPVTPILVVVADPLMLVVTESILERLIRDMERWK
jgi:hypothetical protein